VVVAVVVVVVVIFVFAFFVVFAVVVFLFLGTTAATPRDALNAAKRALTLSCNASAFAKADLLPVVSVDVGVEVDVAVTPCLSVFSSSLLVVVASPHLLFRRRDDDDKFGLFIVILYEVVILTSQKNWEW